LDEHRQSFSPTLWYLLPEKCNVPERGTRLKQCWFPGVHTDVGRGYNDHAPGDIADITFAWMVDQCCGLLAFNEKKVRQMMEKGDFRQPEDEDAKRRREDKVRRAQNWGLAYLHDSMGFIFKIGGSMTRTPGQYTFKPRDWDYEKTDSHGSGCPSGSGFVTKSKTVTDSPPKKKPWYSSLWSTPSGIFSGSSEDVVKLAPVWTSEDIHPSVRVRMIHDPTYDPPALRGFKLMYDATRTRWTWVKEWTDTNGEVRRKRLHEYRIEDPSLALSKVTAEILGSGVGEEVPLLPRQTNGSWFRSGRR